jgi:hypothetical protein
MTMISGYPTTASQDRQAEACLPRDVTLLQRVGTGMSAIPYVGLLNDIFADLSHMRSVVKAFQWVSALVLRAFRGNWGNISGDCFGCAININALTLPSPTMCRLCAVAGRFGAPPGAGSRPRGPNSPPEIQKARLFTVTYHDVRLKSGLRGRVAGCVAGWSAAQGHALRGAA